MKPIIYFISSLLCSIMTINVFAQCTEEKDAEMAKYMEKTKNQDAQGCSQCGMLALYFCSAKYCVKDEDKAEVGRMIAACKSNIVQMGQPYCCPEYLNKEPQWGIMAGSAQNGQGSTTTTTNVNTGGQSNPSNNTALGKDYRTTEDGINKLFNDADFINDVVKLGSEDLTLEKLDQYYTKYVPEYANFKNANNIDFNNIYYANTQGVSTDVVANKVGELFGLNSAESQNFKDLFSGNLVHTPTNSFSKVYGNLLYEKGKDAEVDYVVDYAVDFFQNNLGDGGTNSALFDLGGEILGNLLTNLDKWMEDKSAADALLERRKADYYIFSMGNSTAYDKVNDKEINKLKDDQSDLYVHFKANKIIGNIPRYTSESINYDEGIKLLTEAINLYKKNPERASYLYLAYVSRGKCKMQIGAYRAAIIDYYYGQEILENILNGKLPDNCIETKYPIGFFDANDKNYFKGKGVTTIGHFSFKDEVVVLIDRAFAKYRASDFKGSIADCNLAMEVLTKNNIQASEKPNDYIDIIQAVIAISQFGLENYKDSYSAFSRANLNEVLIGNNNDLADNNNLDKQEGYSTKNYYGLPSYFRFDIAQIKGLCYYKANMIKDAIDIYETLISTETGNSKNHEAPKMFTKAGGDISSVYSTLGSFYYELGDKTKAISLLDNAIKLNPYQLDYYFKRGTYKKELGQITEANLDFKIVKDPESIAVIKKNEDYYTTKYTKLSSESNPTEGYIVLKEALTAYPEDQSFFNLSVKHLLASKSETEANEMANLLTQQDKKYHLLQSLRNEFSANMQGAETEMNLAFESGLGFYEAYTLHHLNLQEKPYYFKLFVKYSSKTNNNFIPLDFDRSKMTAELDSIYAPMKENASGLVKKFTKIGCDFAAAKALGNIENYLALLNKNKGMAEIFALYTLDKVECLIILKNVKEALDFAKKNIALNKFMSMDSNEDSKSALRALQTIIESGCGL